MSLAQRLLDIMGEQNLTEAALGKKAGISQQAIHKIVKGETQKPRNLIAIASALNVDPIWLVSGVGPRQNIVPASYSIHHAPLAEKEKVILPIHPALRSFDPHIFHLDKATIAHQKNLPSHFQGKQGLYGFYMQDIAMTPRFKMGDLIIVDSFTPPKSGEDCVFIHHNIHDKEITAISVLCFSHIKDGEVIAFQYNPRKEFSFHLQNISLHRILQIEDFLT